MGHAAIVRRHKEIARSGPAFVGGHNRHVQKPILISENSSLDLSTQLRPEALGSHRRGSPPKTGTAYVSHTLPATEYAIRDPSGENTGLIFGRLS